MQQGVPVAIQPIDLQTIYTQLDKVGKLQGDVQQSFAAEFEKKQQANKEDAVRRQQTVQKAESADSEKLTVNKDAGGGTAAFSHSSFQKKKRNRIDEKDSYQIKDPLLGKKIDISG